MKWVLGAFACIVVLSGIAESAEPNLAIQILTGGSSKVWVSTAINYNLAVGSSCPTDARGIEYVFSADQNVVERTCTNGQVREVVHEWSYRNDGIDDFISWDGTEYRLVLSSRTDDLGLVIEEAILRIDGGTSEATVDILLQAIH